MDWETRLDEKLTADLPDLKILRDEPMKRHTSFRIGGPAKRMAFPVRAGQLCQLLEIAQTYGVEPYIIGNGTNLLVPDAGIDGLVISTRELRQVEVGAEKDTLMVQSGCLLRRAAEFALEQGLSGLEFAHGIPGSMGGAVCMNAGAYNGEMSRVVQGAEILFPDGPRFIPAEELHFAYRHSLLTEQPRAVVLSALVRLEPGDPEKISARMRELMERRRNSQPLDYPSAGSTFKRPPGYFAGTLIEQCGLKGLQIGGARVSEKHAGFIINTGDATSADVTALIAEVQKRVFARTGVTLEPEVKILAPYSHA